MGENSKIEWTDHTFNPWTGCRAVSPACDHCYAESWAKRTGRDFAERRLTSAANWRKPLKWDAQAKAEGRRYRVFCASLADVFDAEVPDEWRDRLFALIAMTPNLDWLLLTKRPKVARDYLTVVPLRRSDWLGDCPWPLPNVWLGTTVENQALADARIPLLLDTPAAVRFLSCEPLLGPVDLTALKPPAAYEIEDGRLDALTGEVWEAGFYDPDRVARIDWVIAGGESGSSARPSHPEWARSLRDQCDEVDVPFFFKQWGEWIPCDHAPQNVRVTQEPGVLSRDGTWRQPQAVADPPGHQFMLRVGRKAAGRLLDGRLHDDVPEVRHG